MSEPENPQEETPQEETPQEETSPAPEPTPAAEPEKSAAPDSGGAESSNRSVMIVLSYLWILALIPLLVEKNDAEVQWHAKHGLVLTGAEVLLYVLLSVLGLVPVLGCVLVPVWMVLWLAIMVLRIVCIVKGLKGERFIIPGLSQYADKF